MPRRSPTSLPRPTRSEPVRTALRTDTHRSGCRCGSPPPIPTSVRGGQCKGDGNSRVGAVGLRLDPAAVPLDDVLARGQSDPAAGVLVAVLPPGVLARLDAEVEDLLERIFHFRESLSQPLDPDSVVADLDDPGRPFAAGGDAHPRSSVVGPELQRV